MVRPLSIRSSLADKVLDPTIASNPYLGALVPRPINDKHTLEHSANGSFGWRRLPDVLPSECEPVDFYSSFPSSTLTRAVTSAAARARSGPSSLESRLSLLRYDAPANCSELRAPSAMPAQRAPRSLSLSPVRTQPLERKPSEGPSVVLHERPAPGSREAYVRHERAYSGSSDESTPSLRSAIYALGKLMDGMEGHNSSW